MARWGLIAAPAGLLVAAGVWWAADAMLAQAPPELGESIVVTPSAPSPRPTPSTPPSSAPPDDGAPTAPPAPPPDAGDDDDDYDDDDDDD
ncbi:hypothetical protein [Paramicrobacterium humi]|uniref:hypothetical protein n=1 Tax=Paramicrobacterium humi TaxID=640635 RepID=UPI0015A0BC77|nr:hypothetical protein [Microbacterium humi]